ncbi:MAG: hypothetical protein ACM3TT_06800 [Syntrophothermus sp.]
MDDSYSKRFVPCLFLIILALLLGVKSLSTTALAWERDTLQIPWAQDEIGKLVAAGIWPRELTAKSPEVPLTQAELAQILNRVLMVTSGFKSLTGQVRAVEPAQGLIQVATGGEVKTLRVSRDAIIYREGQPASLVALRPISSDDFQEIYAIFNPWGELAYIEGFFVGAEVILQRLDPVARTLTVNLPAAGKNASQTLALSKDLRVVVGGNTVELDQLRIGRRAFVVLDIDGMAKKIVQ